MVARIEVYNESDGVNILANNTRVQVSGGHTIYTPNPNYASLSVSLEGHGLYSGKLPFYYSLVYDAGRSGSAKPSAIDSNGNLLDFTGLSNFAAVKATDGVYMSKDFGYYLQKAAGISPALDVVYFGEATKVSVGNDAFKIYTLDEAGNVVWSLNRILRSFRTVLLTPISKDNVKYTFTNPSGKPIYLLSMGVPNVLDGLNSPYVYSDNSVMCRWSNNGATVEYGSIRNRVIKNELAVDVGVVHFVELINDYARV